MNYPYDPYGQGFPGHQPGYPPPQTYYPQQGYPYQPAQPAPPSGTTAIIAIVLAGLGGVVNFFGGIVMAFSLAVIMDDATATSGLVSDRVWTWLVVITILNVLCGVLLLTGTVTLLLRKMIGRWFVVAGCVATLLATLVSLALVPSSIGEYEYNRGIGPDAVGLLFALATVVLVLLPSTAAWIQAKRNPPAPQYYPPYPR